MPGPIQKPIVRKLIPSRVSHTVKANQIPTSIKKHFGMKVINRFKKTGSLTVPNPAIKNLTTSRKYRESISIAKKMPKSIRKHYGISGIQKLKKSA